MSLVTPFIPFLNMSFGAGWLPVVIVAIVLGLINALIVPLAKRILKGRRNHAPLIAFAISAVIDAVALLLTSVIASRSFSIDFLTAIVIAVILAAVNGGISLRSKD